MMNFKGCMEMEHAWIVEQNPSGRPMDPYAWMTHVPYLPMGGVSNARLQFVS